MTRRTSYYHFNKTTPLGTDPAIYLKNYNTEYYKFAGQIQTNPTNSTNMTSSYDPTTGRLWGSYRLQLKTTTSIYGKDVKTMLARGQKQAIIDLLGGTPSKEITDAMDLMNPTSPKFSPKVQGYLYFAPYITEYEKLETPVSTNNLIMQSVDFIDKNGAVATAISAGESYTARYYVKYVGTDMTETCNVRIGVGNTKNIKTGSVYYIGSPWAKTYPAKMKNGQVIQINVGPFVAKEESAYTDGRLDLDAKYNTNSADDYTEKQIGPPPNGNMELSSIDFLDSSGNPVTEPVLNQMYTARYYVKYTGPKMTSNVTVKLNSGYIRNLKSGSTNYMSSPWSRSMLVKVNSGDIFYFDVGPFKATQLSIYACGTLGPDAIWNATSTDDFNEREITGIAENLILSIDSINPPETKVYYPSSQTSQNYEIEYIINYSTSQNMGLVTDVVLTIPGNSYTNPSSRTITTYVSLSPGTNRFSIFTGSLGVKYGDGSFPITLEVNKSRKAPAKETTFGDNVDTIKEKIESIAPSVVNPCVGTSKEFNSWNVTYNISTKTGSVNTYFPRTCTASYCDDWDSVTGKCTSRTRYTYDCSYWRCVGGNVRNWSQTSTRTENLDIVAVNFTSRGGGTVNLLEKSGYIKAGYGFDLEIIARYWGTESPSRPSEWGGCNYQTVSPGEYAMNPFPNTIYVVLPVCNTIKLPQKIVRIP